MNTENTYNVEEKVEEFRNAHPSGLFVDCGFDAPFYQPVFEEEVRWLRTALQSAHAEGVKAGEEKERERIKEAIASIKMEEAAPFSASDTYRSQAELINQHLMPHIRERFIQALTPDNN